MAAKLTIRDIMNQTDFDGIDLERLLLEAKAATEAFNEAVLENVHTDIQTARAKGQKAVADFNEMSKLLTYHKLLKTENPMEEAIRICYLDTITFSVGIDKETEMEKAKIGDTKTVINLIELEDAAPMKLSTNGQWRYWIEKFTAVCAARANDDIGGDKKEFSKTYKLSDEAKVNSPSDMKAVPTSTNNLTKHLQSVIDAIMFVDNGKGLNTHKVMKADINRILYLMCSRGKDKLSVRMPRTSTMASLITEAYHRILTSGQYAAEYDKVEAKKA